MYPGTIVNWYDQSVISTATTDTVNNKPLFMQVSSFDRGPEDLRVVSGTDFFDLYGSTMHFAKHGQAAIQCANIINGGGKLLVKRIVATDALLANIVYVATLTTTETITESTDAAASSLTYFTTGVNDSTAAKKYIVKTGGEAATTVKWSAVAVTNCKNYDAVKAAAEKLYVAPAATTANGTGDAAADITVTKTATLPMIIIADNGRGVSSKSVKFSPDYSTSKDMANMFYTVIIYDGTTKLESTESTFNPSAVFNSKLYGLSEDTSKQVTFGVIDGMYDKYLAMLEETTGMTATALQKCDLIFLTDNKKAAISSKLTLDKESTDINSTYGIELQDGSNGALGDSPCADTTSDAYKALVAAEVAAFGGSDAPEEGQYDDKVWDVDVYKIAAIFDANYADDVKTAIAKFVEFREDCMYFRDYGTSVDSYAAIVAKYTALQEEHKNKFIADYCTTYKIYDPETKVRIPVTMMYDFSRAAITHFATGAYRPLAGYANDMILTNAIEGTINFSPRITPAINQKSLMDDMRINYAIFQDGQCIVQSLYTSQADYTQLSYANNVLGIQEVVRSVRTACPKQRYTFTSGSDFTIYADAVNVILQNFKSNFAELSFSYEQNSLKASQKIFYAVINFRFNNWSQTEVFDVYALPDNS